MNIQNAGTASAHDAKPVSPMRDAVIAAEARKTPRRPHLMIDLETMGNGHDAAIAAIGAAVFDPLDAAWRGPTFYFRVDFADAFRHGAADGGTVAWWLRQSEAARMALLPPSGHKAPKLAEALGFLAAFYAQAAADGGWKRGEMPVWSHGASFDIVILESALRACGLAEPWRFSAVRDTRTIQDLAGIDKTALPQRPGTHHNALDDALFQAGWVAAAFTAMRAAPRQAREACDLMDRLTAAFEAEKASLAEKAARAAVDAELARMQIGEARSLLARLAPDLAVVARAAGRTKAARTLRGRLADLQDALGRDPAQKDGAA